MHGTKAPNAARDHETLEAESRRERVVLVTGAASGIGAATARRLARDGLATIVLVDRDEKRLEDLADSLERQDVRTLLRAHDVTDESEWAATADNITRELGRLDIVIANAGISDAAPIHEMSLERWRRVIAVNLDGVFLTLRATMPLIREGGRGGAIVVVASAAGQKAEPGVGAYGASKAGAIQLARVAAKEGAPDRIRVNAILPGGVETPMWSAMPFFRDLVTQKGSEAAAFEAMAATATPLGRYATADEVAAQIAHLVSHASASITGATVVMDGGYSL